jgi:hypothetical protein
MGIANDVQEGRGSGASNVGNVLDEAPPDAVLP